MAADIEGDAKTADALIAALGLAPHPEGGHYRETYRCAKKAGERSAATGIYFLLRGGERSRFHRLRSDELWYYHAGAAIAVQVIRADGRLERLLLGPDVESGQSFQVLIPAGDIFAAELADPAAAYGLASCVVAPGFDFADFHLFGRDELLGLFPAHRETVARFT